MYTEGPDPVRSATDPVPFANPSARLNVPTRTMHANAMAQAVVRVRRVKRVARRRTGRGMRGAERRGPNKHSAEGVRWLAIGQTLVTFPKTPRPVRAAGETRARDGIGYRAGRSGRLGGLHRAHRSIRTGRGGRSHTVRFRNRAECNPVSNGHARQRRPEDPASDVGRTARWTSPERMP